MVRSALFALVLGALLALVAAAAGDASSASLPPLMLQVDDSVLPRVAKRMTALLGSVATHELQVVPASESVNPTLLPAGAVVVAVGELDVVKAYNGSAAAAGLGPEGYVARGCAAGEVAVLVGSGMADEGKLTHGGGGAGFAAYELLQLLGFGFLHPLDPLVVTAVPSVASLGLGPCTGPVAVRAAVHERHLRIRGYHIHTMHPLELTNMFNGFGVKGPGDEASFNNMLTDELPNVCEWMVANLQNRVEWVVLYAQEWAQFATSNTRQARLAAIVAELHSWGLAAGADVPIAEIQQHAWPMVHNTGSAAEQEAQIHASIDWFMAAGFDFISTENGYSEFTHPDDELMLTWMNVATAYIADTYGKRMYIKCHCSTGQTCKNFDDPRTGKPLNFNFLPIYADSRLGIMPHTVQTYTLDEPAPTYGNLNFTYMEAFTAWQAGLGEREVVYHCESAYWVNYDIDVPLFLPVYGLNRLVDLRRLASSSPSLDGQMVFDSGWEWGYWLHDVVVARAAYDPSLDIASDHAAFAEALRVPTAPFGSAQDDVIAWLMAMVEAETQLLIYGNVTGHIFDGNDASVVKANGQAYLEGWDSFADIGALSKHALATQPNRIGLQAIRLDSSYPTHLAPLLAAMNTTFGELVVELEQLADAIPARALPMYNELVQSSRVLAARAAQVYALYDYAHYWSKDKAWRAARLATAEAALETAMTNIRAREAAYRVPLDRIAFWGAYPVTVYNFGYVWTAHSGYYFWRDYAVALDAEPAVLSPCFLNIQNPVDTALGEGIALNVTHLLDKLLDEFKWTREFIAPCLFPPHNEPIFPRDLYNMTMLNA
ncbi:uncharacterized protein AMSG_00493 [Thecamonas trahens ATCC 50062]|uniref:Uncharacterized protein n=1 Tax=Thecamonas trahens ATCC 50062 TaxID=461836 RepID=A0A0L0DBP2_THETB|nr:hypothetical protein AMSG_00493 [Thecamonas trahens ATCC 50062]KNC48718.1 hypothetical protein AMSG_00493 [Thecamonas trahens ATCC 50062]|eukprot:XP_013762770.1 hypothetical protein AMSG_00493 [Thecamonas trahens ATCC 50062]